MSWRRFCTSWRWAERDPVAVGGMPMNRRRVMDDLADRSSIPPPLGVGGRRQSSSAALSAPRAPRKAGSRRFVPSATFLLQLLALPADPGDSLPDAHLQSLICDRG